MNNTENIILWLFLYKIWYVARLYADYEVPPVFFMIIAMYCVRFTKCKF
jgi:hypothetical protein